MSPARAEIERAQTEAFRRLVREVLPANPFYTAKWGAAGVDAGSPLAELPFTTKHELTADQEAHPPFGTNLTYPLERYTRFCQTSGTTGTPLRWLDTSQTWGWMVDNWVQVFRSSGVNEHDRIFFAFSFGPFLGFWTAYEAGVRLGALCLPGGGMSSSARVRAVLDNGVTALCCTPTYAIRLGEVAASEGVELGSGQVRTILVAGEPGASIPETRARIERLWPGARVRDHHGMTEVGPVTYECPERAGVLHVMEAAFIPEVIDQDTLAPVAAGTPGELVLTNLGRAGSPLVRYRTGDLVRASTDPACSCGSAEMALEGGILGRVDDMVVVRGVNLYPSALEGVLRRFEDVQEYRVEVRSVDALAEVRVELEPAAGCAAPEALCRNVETALRSAFNLRVPVGAVPVGSLPRFELKAKRWVYLSSESDSA
jgi:phenylacetate-CoA ligase